jgi:hypothetical protein
MRIENWSFRKLILFWVVAIAQVAIVLAILFKPFPIKPESYGFFVIVTTALMIAESALVTSIAMLVVSWKWLRARQRDRSLFREFVACLRSIGDDKDYRISQMVYRKVATIMHFFSGLRHMAVTAASSCFTSSGAGLSGRWAEANSTGGRRRS